jgi:Rps23 Pro-64 3,4-dihydroxylase Tpa1-like proline 4-hydroxylase
MNRNTPLKLSAVRTFSEPFPYLVSLEALKPEVSLTVLTWFEIQAPWELVETDFYEQFECSLWDVQLPANLVFLRASSFISAVKKRMAERFDASLSDHVDITAHKLVPGQRIRLHNDFIPGAETHRLLIQFNRGWHDENGGLLIFFNSADPADMHKIFQPVHNSAVGFAISATSYHAVSKLHGGERFTLVYSFYER